MNIALSLRLALRYVRGKRGANIVPVLSRISMVALAVGSAAMIILFSVFNGFETIVRDLYKAFYPDVRITTAKGKFFTLTPDLSDKIAHWHGVERIAPVIEDNVLLNTEDQQVVATPILKGIDNSYFAVNEVQPYITHGRDSLVPDMPNAIIGIQIAAKVGLDVNNDFSKMQVTYPNNELSSLQDPTQYFQSLILKPDGIFRVQDEFDDKYILAPISLVQELFKKDGQLSSLELKLDPAADPDEVQHGLQQLLGGKFKVETRFEQNHTLYQVLRSEKWATFAILTFVLLIASVNMIGALSLLVLEKRKDMAILSAMGLGRSTIRTVFILEGMLWAAIGGGTGILLGGLICWGQQRFSWVELNGSFVIKAYPVAMQPSDFFLVALTVLIVGLVAAWYPAMRATSANSSGETVYARLR